MQRTGDENGSGSESREIARSAMTCSVVDSNSLPDCQAALTCRLHGERSQMTLMNRHVLIWISAVVLFLVLALLGV